MDENYKIEIISPEKIIFSEEVKMAVLPAYEGYMSILKQHIPIVTFLRPGIVKLQKKDENSEEFFIEDGIVEFFNDTLVLLSSSVINKKKLTKNHISELNKKIESRLSKGNISDEDQYILNHKLDALKELGV